MLRSSYDPISLSWMANVRCAVRGCRMGMTFTAPDVVSTNVDEPLRLVRDTLTSKGWWTPTEWQLEQASFYCPAHKLEQDAYQQQVYPYRKAMVQATEASSGFERAILKAHAEYAFGPEQWGQVQALRAMQAIVAPEPAPSYATVEQAYKKTPIGNPAASALAGVIAGQTQPTPAKHVCQTGQGYTRACLSDSYVAAGPFPGYRSVKEAIA
jgi:hypothetical protein